MEYVTHVTDHELREFIIKIAKNNGLFYEHDGEEISKFDKYPYIYLNLSSGELLYTINNFAPYTLISVDEFISRIREFNQIKITENVSILINREINVVYINEISITFNELKSIYNKIFQYDTN